jgi:predicted nucleic acid-binding protein
MEQIVIGGAQIHDANIVATMQVYNIPTLLTHNTKDFKRFSSLISIMPLIE